MTDSAPPRNVEPGTPPDAVEGLAWLGRPPNARSNPLYWLLTTAGRLTLRLDGHLGGRWARHEAPLALAQQAVPLSMRYTPRATRRNRVAWAVSSVG